MLLALVQYPEDFFLGLIDDGEKTDNGFVDILDLGTCAAIMHNRYIYSLILEKLKTNYALRKLFSENFFFF